MNAVKFYTTDLFLSSSFFFCEFYTTDLERQNVLIFVPLISSISSI
jgi:hypothetical protein